MGREAVFHFLIFVHLNSFLLGLSVEIGGFSQANHSCPLCWRIRSYQVVKCGVILNVERIVWTEASWGELLEDSVAGTLGHENSSIDPTALSI